MMSSNRRISKFHERTIEGILYKLVKVLVLKPHSFFHLKEPYYFQS